MSKELTAVEWLLEELIECGADFNQVKDCIQKAKEMEKQQQGFSEEKINKILKKIEEIKIMINVRGTM